MIQIQQLTKRYDGSAVVDRLDLSVEAGRLLVLLGPSGCGKTTTLKMINRLIEPTDGRVLIDGTDTRSTSPVDLRRSIGYVFQGIGLFPHMTVARNVGIVGELLGWDSEAIDARVDELLALVELDPADYRHRRPDELSGGQQQRVGVARALCGRPKLMLMDEPFGALDPITRDNLQQQFAKLQRSLNMTVIFVTHDMTEALLISDSIAVMREGRLVQHGSPYELLNEPADEYVRRLMATPKRQADRVEALAGGDGRRPDRDAS
ncbi:MAG: ABC transporter ATP-binding protein [Planctomycetes bacterium]|nr:ABC transporter ATP-binding protein [Planctomycetota bacterium]